MTGAELEKLHTLTHYQDAAGQAQADRNAEVFRIPNGTLIEMPSLDWVGVVVDQAGPNVFVTIPGKRYAWLDRESIVKRVWNGQGGLS